MNLENEEYKKENHDSEYLQIPHEYAEPSEEYDTFSHEYSQSFSEPYTTDGDKGKYLHRFTFICASIGTLIMIGFFNLHGFLFTNPVEKKPEQEAVASTEEPILIENEEEESESEPEPETETETEVVNEYRDVTVNVSTTVDISDYAYDDIQYIAGEYYAVCKDDKWGVIDINGTSLIEMEYDSVEVKQQDGCFFLIKNNGNMKESHLFDSELKEIYSCTSDKGIAAYYDGMVMMKGTESTTYLNSDNGFAEAFTMNTTSITAFNQGYAVCTRSIPFEASDGTTYYVQFVDKQGTYYLFDVYSDWTKIDPISGVVESDGVNRAKIEARIAEEEAERERQKAEREEAQANSSGIQYTFNGTGAAFIGTDYTWSTAVSDNGWVYGFELEHSFFANLITKEVYYADNVAQVKLFGLLNNSLLRMALGDIAMSSTTNGYVPYDLINKDYIGTNGYYSFSLYTYDNGIMLANIKKGRHWGYIDQNYNLISDEFPDATDFYGEYALVHLNGGEYVINRQMEYVSELFDGESAYCLSENTFALKKSDGYHLVKVQEKVEQ